ncbi:hypothetical protein ACTMU2_28730 [Cupriavidus basilensis]
MSLVPTAGAVTVLLGATQAGKTSPVRCDGRPGPAQRRPCAGRWRRRDRRAGARAQRLDGVPCSSSIYTVAARVRQHCIATAAAAAGQPRRRIAARVRSLAARLHIDHLLDRIPG